MKYFDTIHKRNSARITVLIVLLLFLLLFFVGPQYMDPPEEYGVAVNFGTTDLGRGNQPLANPREGIEEKEIKPEPVEEVSEPEPEQAVSNTEDVLTEESAEEIAIKKQKEAERKAKALADKIAKEKKEAEEKKKREQDAKRKQLDNLIGGVKNSNGKDNGGEGPDGKNGNKGEPDGNPYAPSYFGGGKGKGGVGYGLGGRGKPTRKVYKQQCNEFGLVVVKIEVNRLGKVINAIPGQKGTTNTDPCLLEPAKKIALSHKWPADNKAPKVQIGFVSINFEVGQ